MFPSTPPSSPLTQLESELCLPSPIFLQPEHLMAPTLSWVEEA